MLTFLKNIFNESLLKDKQKLFFLVVILAVIIFIFVIAILMWPINITVNGNTQSLSIDKTLNKAFEDSGITVKPGNFIAVDDSILEENKGHEYCAKVNNKEINDKGYRLSEGDVVEFSDGKDIMEDYTSSEDTEIPAVTEINGIGAIHKISGTGEPGTWSKVTGNVSHIYAERVTKEPNNITSHNYNINTEDDKVIALTFDDGPSESYTEKVLDLLNEYDAKATFFVLGVHAEKEWGKKLLQRENSEGHLVCTHTYDHGKSSSIANLSPEDKKTEMEKGIETIADALNTKNVSRICRLPGGSSNPNTVEIISKFADAEIGWNIDSTDWHTPGTAAISAKLNKASNGDIILCHDGGGNRSQTIEALASFLKEYKDNGYRFVTIEELMNYPEAPQKKTS